MADDALILVVEDDARLRGQLQRYLSANGYRVSAAEDAADARAQAVAVPAAGPVGAGCHDAGRKRAGASTE